MKKHIFFIFLLSLLLMLLAGCQTTAEENPLSASLSELSGLVEMKQTGQSSFNPVEANSVLSVNGQIQTGIDGRVRLDLSTGTIIRIAPTSLFTLTSNDQTEGGLLTKIKLEAGKVFIILNGGQADVETPSGVASVKGSYLSVKVENRQIVITCLEGTCSLNDLNGSTIIIPQGFKITIIQDPNTGEWNVPVLDEMTPEEFKEWLDENPEAKELVEQGIADLTAQASTEAPTEEPTAPATEVDSVTPESGASNACSQLKEPADGSDLGKFGSVNFSWTEQPNAQYYVITFLNESRSARVETTNTSVDLFIEVLPAGGTYTWFVTAYGSDGAEICASTSVTFTKPQADPTQKVPPSEEATQDPQEQSPATEPPATEDPCIANPYLCYGY